MYNKGIVVQCKVVGFQWNWDKNSSATNETVPHGTYAWLRRVHDERQILCEEFGVEVVAFIIKTKLLLPIIDNELEKCGYSSRYHRVAEDMLGRAFKRFERF